MRLITNELLGQLERVQIPSSKQGRFHQRGEKVSRRKGSSVEFSDYREYLQGDDIRSIDWNVYARTERYFLKLFLEEESKPVYFVIDGSQSMSFGQPSKFEFAVAFAAALSYASLRRYDRPHLVFLRDGKPERFTILSQRQFFPILRELESQSTSGHTHLSSSLRKIAFARYPRGIYFVLSDFYSYDGFEGLKVLTALGNELHCLQVLTDEESNPGLRGDLRLIDCETSDHSDVSISPQLLKRYHSRLHALQRELKATTRRCFASCHTVSTSTPLASLILEDLRKAGVLL